MNTILQKRIEEAAKDEREKCREDNNEIWRGNPTYNDVEASFIKGATFSLQKQWISVDEALPEFEGNFSDYYIIRTEDGWCAVTMYYRTSKKEYWWNFEKTKVTHWMEIPKLKGGEK